MEHYTEEEIKNLLGLGSANFCKGHLEHITPLDIQLTVNVEEHETLLERFLSLLGDKSGDSVSIHLTDVPEQMRLRLGSSLMRFAGTENIAFYPLEQIEQTTYLSVALVATSKGINLEITTSVPEAS